MSKDVKNDVPIDPKEIRSKFLIDPEDKDIQKLLKKIQGNILKSHGRDYSVLIFIKFDNRNIEKLRKKLIKFAKKNITSAWQQYNEARQYKKFNIMGNMFGNIFISAKGYSTLGFSKEQVEKLLPERLFLDGMKNTNPVVNLNDPPPSEWEEGYQQKGPEKEIDAMFLFADDDKNFLARQTRNLINKMEKFCKILVVEHGYVLRDKNTDQSIEHFGYADGISQPIYFNSDHEKQGKTDEWDPADPLRIVLQHDKTVKDDIGFGSYLVFRKLEQDVFGFKVREFELANLLNIEHSEKGRVGAMVFGRFEDGTPIVLSPKEAIDNPTENNFTYKDDSEGLKCPFHSHIRRTNPREKARVTETDLFGRLERITRRGVSYGERKIHPSDSRSFSDLPRKDVGLLFMCFQASIARQFGFIQGRWANHGPTPQNPHDTFAPDHILKPSIDPVIGQLHPKEPIHPHKWRPNWGDKTSPQNEEIEFVFKDFVKMKGGEFFFAPSMPFLKRFAPPD